MQETAATAEEVAAPPADADEEGEREVAAEAAEEVAAEGDAATALETGEDVSACL